MNILSIETSCDDTSISVLKNNSVISMFTNSQIENHKKFGGVIPELASRLHSKNIHKLIKKTIDDSGIKITDLDAITFTIGPGLVNTLQVGLLVAKTLSLILNIPFYGINHLDAHLYSPFIGKNKESIPKKSIFLIISGGHTIIGLKNNNELKILGKTRDDAIGESYDKVAKILNLSSYPGGQIIDSRFEFLLENNFKTKLVAPITNLSNYDFSYSGLKSWIDKNKTKYSNDELVYAFQKSAMDQILLKIKKAFNEFNTNNIIIAGGASANLYLRNEIKKIKNINAFFPKLIFSGDNAAMIGNYFYFFKNNLKPLNLDEDVKPKLMLGD